eukprot:s108_g36.t1
MGATKVNQSITKRQEMWLKLQGTQIHVQYIFRHYWLLVQDKKGPFECLCASIIGRFTHFTPLKPEETSQRPQAFLAKVKETTRRWKLFQNVRCQEGPVTVDWEKQKPHLWARKKQSTKPPICWMLGEGWGRAKGHRSAMLRLWHILWLSLSAAMAQEVAVAIDDANALPEESEVYAEARIWAGDGRWRRRTGVCAVRWMRAAGWTQSAARAGVNLASESADLCVERAQRSAPCNEPMSRASDGMNHPWPSQ